ncbi:hypothetical protein [uncultured Polaribacter sp.]|uniref:hypothetical protein n=1 Tax=uncultured Polaribacter sp. TaxID=174711 RepID=UPI00261656FC|nr:hypothetical protein [uncultured Polaribacter sp.]
MKQILYCLVYSAILFSCNSSNYNVADEENNLCYTEDLGIGIESKDPFNAAPKPNPFFSATHKWLWGNTNENLKVFSRGEVSDEAVEYSVFEFSFDENGCLVPVLFSTFIVETEITLNPATNQHEIINSILNYAEDSFTIQVEAYKENELLKAKVSSSNNLNIEKNIFAELIPENKEKII